MVVAVGCSDTQRSNDLRPPRDGAHVRQGRRFITPWVLGISGRLCAGKTTAARVLESFGFQYTRFSLVIDDEIRRRGELPDRQARQRIGFEINRELGQSWLCQRVLERVAPGDPIVVDGLRWPADRTFFVERFGEAFVHLHIIASARSRALRFMEGETGDFERADGQPVEAAIDELGSRACIKLRNEGSLPAFREEVARLGRDLLAGE